ncbi:MAG: ribosome biogenesis GTPase Der [Candidatus Gracilibacteria bacterium]
MKTDATIAIIGKPNVGKSTLFNRIIGRRLAVIAKEAGTTRDRIQQDFDLDEYKICLIDTGGLQTGKKKAIEADVEKQAKIGIEKADIILFVTNALQNLTTDDFAVANALRKAKKQVILVANKCDSQKAIEENIYNIYELGFGEPVQVSAIHKSGMDTLYEEIKGKLKGLKIKLIHKDEEKKHIKISILGRPNVGKSSLLNSLIGEERVIVSEIPGTTRDATDSELKYKGQYFTLIDTAGIRRRGRIEQGIEKFSILRCKEVIERSDISIIVLDATDPATSQDLHIIEFALKEKNGIILAVNKSDLIKGEKKDSILWKLRYKCDFLPWVPVVFISAKNKKNIFQLLDIAIEIDKTREIQISTPKLNSFLQKIALKQVPSSTGQFKSKLLYGSQTGVNPPKFMLFFKNAKHLHFSYRRYIENEMRKEFEFGGTPISLVFRESP